MEFTNLIGSWFGKNETGDSVMGILCDPTFESGKVDNEKVNDIIATVSFINDAMGKFIENSVIREICDLSTELSKLPGTGVSKVTKLPHSWIVYQVIKDMSYRERLKKCKKSRPVFLTKVSTEP